MLPAIITSKTLELQGRRPQWPWNMNQDSWQAKGLVAWYPLGAHPREGWDFKSRRYDLTNTNNVPVIQSPLMGRGFGFTAASSHHFRTNTPPVTAIPLTIAIWFISPGTTDFSMIVDLHNSAAGATRESFQTLAFGSSGSFTSTCAAADSNSFDTTTSSIAWTANQLTHQAGVFVSATSRIAYINGRANGTNVTSSTPASINRFTIGGRLGTDTIANPVTGQAFDARIYNRPLIDAEVFALYDLKTRWDLYYPIGRIVYSFPQAAVITARVPSRLLLGVGL